jgi:hypothetical protein
LTGQNGEYCGSTDSPTLAGCVSDPSSGTALPLTSLYPSDPCTGIYKRVYIQVTCGPNGTSPSKRVFVTSTTTNGAIGSIATADAACATRATAAGLKGTYKALLGYSSSATGGPRTLSSVTSSTNTYILVDGKTSLGTGLTASGISHAINANELVTSTGTVNVWTGLTTTGALSTNNCSDWTDSTGSGNGEIGSSGSTSSSWIDQGTNDKCSSKDPFYCVEQ